MEKLKILVVDDESRMRKLVGDFLKKKGYEVIEAADGEEALDIFFEDKSISLIICDVMMPKIDGFEVVKEIRQYSQVPIIMLTAKGEESDELNGFDLGVDEYIAKPFSPKILVARVEAILRRSNSLAAGEVLEAGGIELDIAAHEVKIDGKPISLSFKEFELLTYFVMNQGVALSREKILNNVWNYDYFGDARTIDTHVKKLRSKLGDKGEYIKTIWGMGYKFEVPEEGDYFEILLHTIQADGDPDRDRRLCDRTFTWFLNLAFADRYYISSEKDQDRGDLSGCEGGAARYFRCPGER